MAHNMAHAKKTKRITEKEFVLIINEEYARAKRELNPMLKGLNRSFIKFYWHKPNNYGGVCWGAMKEITVNEDYKYKSNEDKWSTEQFRLMIRHEFVHLAISYKGLRERQSHGGRFMSLLKVIGGHRYVGAPMYTGPEPKKKAFYELK